ncbi:DUF6508 domain-containing protein [Streptomyces radicis]|uniref:Uncharacterized protein n=1 Tax=Streptomyces radicis TaxID=1750517 RepID=A0A3A9WMI3_9ACTN|nr:DUF6508 domain-containing protein [Streptomyces radicis]RKN07377.1 hypothetical protein D7319_18655 [Streptomyces radicis]RKN19604.1 hypothetical protein D7318_19870 [Streptomyces radicis]
MSEDGDPDDAALLAGLDTTAQAWARLLALADRFADEPHADDDYRWTRSERGADGVVRIGCPVYGERVVQARRALAEVGAVTPAYHWMRRRVPYDGGALSPGDAVRMATAVVRGERFNDGFIGRAVESGALAAILAALATWYRDRPGA